MAEQIETPEVVEEKVTEYKGVVEKIAEAVPGEVYQRLTAKPGEHKIPRFFIPEINNLSHNNVRTMVVHTNKGFAKSTITVPGDVEVRRLTGRLSQDFKKRFGQYQLSDLTNRLNRVVSTVGTDPEFFIEVEGKVIPAFHFLNGKDHPHYSPENRESNYKGKQAIYYDGYQAEFTVKAGDCLAYMLDSFQYTLKSLSDLAKAYNPKAKISSKTVIEVSLEELAQGKDEHVQFGCMPSKNVYGLKGLGINGRDAIYRPAGGHMHFGINNLKESEIPNIVKALDAIVGVAATSCFEGHESPRRRELYGQAGEYRTPKHGLEYRVLTNTVFNHPAIAHLFFDLARKAIALGRANLLSQWKATEEETLDVIMGLNYGLAREILKRNEDLLMALLNSCYSPIITPKASEGGYKIIVDGINKVLRTPNDIEANWLITGGWSNHCGSQNCQMREAGLSVLKGNKI